MPKVPITFAAIGCSGPIAEIFVNGLLERGCTLRILARNPAEVAARYPSAQIVAGNLMDPADVARAIVGVEAAFVLTPMGINDDPSLEIAAGKAIIAGAQVAKLRHLIYTSSLGVDHPQGVGILDGKCAVEAMLAQSGIPYSVLRCGTYMQDVFDARLDLLNKGKFLFPVNRTRRFCFVAQDDVVRFVAEELLAKSQVLNGAIDFTAPGTYAVTDVEQVLSEASGHPIRALNKFPAYYLFLAALPWFKFKKVRLGSIIPLIRHFDRHGYVGTGPSVSERFPQFRMTTLTEHLRGLWPG